jgi:hypothetical protein
MPCSARRHNRGAAGRMRDTALRGWNKGRARLRNSVTPQTMMTTEIMRPAVPCSVFAEAGRRQCR